MIGEIRKGLVRELAPRGFSARMSSILRGRQKARRMRTGLEMPRSAGFSGRPGHRDSIGSGEAAATPLQTIRRPRCASAGAFFHVQNELKRLAARAPALASVRHLMRLFPEGQDPTTVLFGVTRSEAAPVHSALEDVDGDGNTDMILHFRTQAIGVVCGDTSASLTGRTLSGQAIEGLDSIRTVGCK